MPDNTEPVQGQNRGIRLWGWTLTRQAKDGKSLPGQDSQGGQQNPQRIQATPVTPSLEDGAINVQMGMHYGIYIDLDGSYRSEVDLLSKYRTMAMQPEMENAIDDVINEAIVYDEDGQVVQIDLDQLKQPDSIKTKIREEFHNVLRLLDFNNFGSDIFRRWYVDGRVYYNLVIDKENPHDGIQQVIYMDPRRVRKIRNITKEKDAQGVEVITRVDVFYLYNEKIVNNNTQSPQIMGNFSGGVKLTEDSVVMVTSGLFDPAKSTVLSYLHKAIRPMNQLRFVEDATVIYRICLTGDTRVKTTKGYKYIKDLKTDDSVYSFNSKEIFEVPVKAVWSNGTKEIFTVKSKHHSITGNETHPILALDNTNGIVGYVDIKDIVPQRHSFVWETKHLFEPIRIPKVHNDAVKLLNPEVWTSRNITQKETFIEAVAENLGIKHTSVRNFLYGLQYQEIESAKNILKIAGISNEAELDTKTEGHCRNQVSLPEYVDVEFARLFGFLLGDGCVLDNGIVFAEGQHPHINELYSSLLRKYFGNCKRHTTPRTYGNYTTNSTLGADILRAMGWIRGAPNKRIPEWVFSASDEIKRQFILGLIDADGVEKHNPYETDLWSAEIELCNKRLIEDIKELWTSLGFASGHIRHRMREGHLLDGRMLPSSESWGLYISSKELPRFEKITTVEPSGEAEVFDIEVGGEKHNFIANGIVVHNSRAPERRAWYIDVSNMPNKKAEQYMQQIMNAFRNKVTYDAATGEITDVTRHYSMIEDYWLPRKSQGNATEIVTLPAGQNLGQMEDVLYFEKKLYRALGVPVSRLEPTQGFTLGKSQEITRDELKFDKFVNRLRARFSILFDELMGRQLALKGICTLEEWQEMKEDIRYDFIKDNNFAELKDQELWTNRLQLLSVVQPYVGVYFSKRWVQETVLLFNEEDIDEMKEEIEEEEEEIANDVAKLNPPPMGADQPGQLGPNDKQLPTSDPNEINDRFKNQFRDSNS